MSVNIVQPDGSLEKIAGMGFKGGGDMLSSVYDPDGTVAEAGGIVEYLNGDFTKLNLIHDISEYESEGVVNVKDYGAVGDGVTDDSGAFISALSEGNIIWIPRGTYNLNHVSIDLTSLKAFVGESKSFVTLLDSNITAPYGIVCKGITFDGGTTGIIRQLDNVDGHPYSGLHTNIYENTIAINVTPYIDLDSQTTVTSNVYYEDCKFTNVGTASLAYQNSHSGYVHIVNDVVKNCIFTDLVCAGIYHMSSIDSGVYIGNVFENIGRNTNVADNIVALKSGDTSNQTEREVTRCIIRDNTFKNIISYNDTVGDAHAGEVNVLTVQAEFVIVENNEILDLLGCGHDREGIYLKAHFAEIAYNYLENAGLGEGYICCKRREKIQGRTAFYTDANVDIHDNTIVGDYGCAIKVYYGADIHDNNIRIGTAKNLIHAGASQDYDINIYNNNMYCGMSYPVTIDGVAVDNYYDNLDGNDKIVVSPLRLYDFRGVYISKNNIVLKNEIASEMTSQTSKPRLIGVQRFVDNISVVENELHSTTSVIGVLLNTNNTYTNDIFVDIEKNVNDTDNSLLRIDMDASTSGYQNIAKQFVIKNNDVKHTSDLYDVRINVGANNLDVLTFDTQDRITISNTNNYILADVAYIDVPNETWVKQYA